jgi:hypothetical protein
MLIGLWLIWPVSDRWSGSLDASDATPPENLPPLRPPLER